MNTKQITITALLNVTAEKAWDYYTQPEHIVHWNFAADTWCCPSASNELWPGGKYSARMEAKDGSFGFDFEAIYDEVIPHNKIIYTMLDGRMATITFEEQNDNTEVTIIFDAEDQNSIELQKNGWQAILDNFKSYTENS
ncbi:MAG TPA: SRPBCC family protein [Saprospiraceae bacterium]|nr:SRPBCC family protein [Saprospiraceae bacterium]